jgi:iron complex outermembrane receptor protein
MGNQRPKFQNGMLLLVFLLAISSLQAQRIISGKVTDASSGETLIGANVLLTGSNIGTITDLEGMYKLEVPDNLKKISFSYTGYSEQIVEIGQSNQIDIALRAGQLLDEIVVIGYGTVKKGDATGSVQSVNSASFNRGAITGAQELLAGKMAGVQITPSAEPGGGAAIRIRGGSSLSAVNDPLIVIDGIPVENSGIAGSRNALNIVNPSDIETFTVLKDASATAIYGSRASNGVILITTKKGKLGKKLNVGYNGSIGFSNRRNEIDVLNGDEFKALVASRFPESHPSRKLLGSSNTDWQAEIFQTGVTHDHNVNLSGGLGIIPYRLSLGVTDRTGILKTDAFNRSTASLNLSPGFLNNTLQVNVSLKAMLSENTFANTGAIGSAVSFDPTKPVLGEAGKFGGFYTWLQNDGTPNPLAPANPMALLQLSNNSSKVNHYIANAQLDYRMPFLPDLRANLNLGYDASRGEGTNIVDQNAAFAFTNKGFKGEYWQDKRNSLLEFYLNYAKTFGKSSLNVMGGYSWQHFFIEDYNYGTNFAGDKILNPINYDPKEYYLVSLFGRMNLDLGSRLLLTATVRQDGTSRFSADNRYGLFPAAALALKIIDAEGKGTLSNLKLRLGYGVTGQQDIGGDYYPYLARYLASQSNAAYQLGNEFVTTLRPNGYDANIKWEETTTYNAALDFGLFSDKLTGSIEYYQRKTTDLINFIPVPAGTNLTNFINTNVGDLENKGVEFSLNANVIETKKSALSVGFNVTMNRNKITRLTATDDPNYKGVFTGGISGGVGNTIQIHSVGYPANSFFVYEQVYDDKGIPVEGLYVDRNKDGRVTPDDRYHWQKPAPDAFYGFNINYRYGKFDLSAAARANVGNYIYNNVLSGQTSYNNLYNATGILNNLQSGSSNIDFAVPQYFSDHFIQNGSFLRVDHITAGYNFTKSGKVSNLRLSATMQNPLLITKYQGLDPEIFGGIDGNIYPRSRTLLIGLSANF